MTIAFISPSAAPAIGGVERHLAEITRILTQRGHKIQLFTAQSGQVRAQSGELVYSLHYSRRTLWQWWRLWQLRGVLRAADLVHCHDYSAFLWYLPFRLLWWRKPVYVTFHGWEGRVPLDFVTVWLRRFIEWFATGSLAVGAFIAPWYGQRPTAVTHGGVEPFSCGRRRGRRAVFVGGLRDDTGIRSYLAAALPLLRNHTLDAFDIVGDGPLRAELEAQVCTMRDRVVFHGFQADIRPFLCKARIACVSSYLAMLEAMMAGARVVATYEHVLKRDYLLMSPLAPHIDARADISGIRQAMKQALCEPGTALRIHAAKEFAATQTWGRVVDIYEALWQV
ncbi:MAG: glycosyltransferase family 4 protein [Patescibacteria group bacterium]|jgi:glycosyltransferase involved in cell wall biosynthesis